MLLLHCRHNSRADVKMEKLDIMIKLVNERNIDQVRSSSILLPLPMFECAPSLRLISELQQQRLSVPA